MNSRRIVAPLVGLALLGGIAFGQEKTEVPLTLEDSIVKALKSNLNIAVEVVGPDLAAAGVSLAREYFMPSLQVDFTGNRYEQPSTWSLQTTGQYIQRSTDSGLSVVQQIPYGGSLSFSLGYTWSKTNQLYQNYNPSFGGTLNFMLTQPLLRNFGLTMSRKAIIVAQNNLEISRSQFKSVLINTVYQVEEAYWNLVYAIENLKVAQQSLELGQDLLAKTKKEVEVGQTAPIEVLSAEAEVASREATILQAESLIKRRQDQLRALLSTGNEPGAAGQVLVPADKPAFKPYTISVEEAMQKAMDMRPDLASAKYNIETKKVNFRVAKNQLLPQLDLRVSKLSPGITGDRFIYPDDNPFLPPIGLEEGSPTQAVQDAFRFLYNNWTVSLTFSIPLGDIISKSNYTQAKLDLQQTEARLKLQEQQIFLEVSDAVLVLETAAKSVQALRIARELSERRLEAEMKKLNVGMTTNYFVLQYQNDLANKRSQELRALVDYNVAVANIAKVTGANLENRNIVF
jgi:outer membrane protein TolC